MPRARSTTGGSNSSEVNRRKRGSGGVIAVRDGVWRIDIEIGRDPVTGRRRRVSRTINGTGEEAELALAKLRVASHEKRLPPKGTNARSVEAVFQEYLRAIASGQIELAPSTANNTRYVCAGLAAVELADGRRFGSIRLSRLTWQDIEALYAAMKHMGRGPATIRRSATILSRALDLARKRGLIDANPARDAARPKTVRSKPYAPTADEVRAVLAVAGKRAPEMADAVTILVSTGVRRGELLGLQWKDVDLAKAEIHVGAAITDGGPGIGLLRKATKRSDWRDVPLTAAAIQAFERQAARRQELTGEAPGPTDYVFSGSLDGAKPMRPEVLGNRWAAARGKSPITLQALRHFAATAMLDAGESYRTVADILGNSEATLRLHYDGRTDTGKRHAIAALELEGNDGHE